MKFLELKPVIIFILTLSFFSAYSDEIDWNDSELNWHDYNEGMEKVKNNKQTGLLIFYADWCSVCKEYSQLFKNPDIVKKLKGIVLIRVNREKSIELSNKYDFDGVYIPRTFAISTDGEIIQSMYDDSERYAFFLPPDDPDFLIRFIEQLNKP